MLPIAGYPTMGVNGVKLFDGHLYYASVTRGQLGRVPLNETASATGTAELIINEVAIYNLDISLDGSVYLAVSTGNQIARLTTEVTILQVVGAKNSTVIA
jgi:hypothetical protein